MLKKRIKLSKNLEICTWKKMKKLKKKLQQKLHYSFKQEDLNSFNKPIYNIRLDGEDQSKKRRLFSKIFTLDENNQYGFAMT